MILLLKIEKKKELKEMFILFFNINFIFFF